MTFTEWYRKETGLDWEESYAELYGYATEMINKYEAWCKESATQPIYDG